MMSSADILDIRRRALIEAAEIAERAAAKNETQAVSMHRRSKRQAEIYGDDDAADQTKISAQVLDACAIEARYIAQAIRALCPSEWTAL